MCVLPMKNLGDCYLKSVTVILIKQARLFVYLHIFFIINTIMRGEYDVYWIHNIIYHCSYFTV